MGVLERCPQFVDSIYEMPSPLHLVAAVLFPISFMIVQAQIFQCLNGGVGPCVNGECLDPSQRCINTTLGELCCEISQIAPLGAPIPGVGGVTTSRPCVDKANPKTGRSDCEFMTRQCSDPKYRDVMQNQCPRTCGFCTVGGSTVKPLAYTECRDLTNFFTGKSDCGERAQLCRNPIYRTLMMQQCPLTCGFCGV